MTNFGTLEDVQTWLNPTTAKPQFCIAIPGCIEDGRLPVDVGFFRIHFEVDQHFGDLPWIKLDRKRFPLQLASGLDKDQKDPRAIVWMVIPTRISQIYPVLPLCCTSRACCSFWAAWCSSVCPEGLTWCWVRSANGAHCALRNWLDTPKRHQEDRFRIPKCGGTAKLMREYNTG